jgi:hypothetical protein
MTFCNSYGKLLMLLKRLDRLGGSLVGETRGKEKQFEIVHGVTRGTLARAGTLSRRYKPTKSFVLRWVFGDIIKADVVCPECDSVLEAENDVPVEW